jgi:hypothetical protein
MDRTSSPISARISRSRVRGGWAWLLAAALAGIAGAVGSSPSAARARDGQEIASPTVDPVDTADRRG